MRAHTASLPSTIRVNNDDLFLAARNTEFSKILNTVLKITFRLFVNLELVIRCVRVKITSKKIRIGELSSSITTRSSDANLVSALDS